MEQDPQNNTLPSTNDFLALGLAEVPDKRVKEILICQFNAVFPNCMDSEGKINVDAVWAQGRNLKQPLILDLESDVDNPFSSDAWKLHSLKSLALQLRLRAFVEAQIFREAEQDAEVKALDQPAKNAQKGPRQHHRKFPLARKLR